MIAAAAERGYAYHSISDHSWGRGPIGLTPGELRAQRDTAREIGERHGIRTLCSAEVDIQTDGSLDFDDAVLAELDFVVASVHDATNISREAMTRAAHARVRESLRQPHRPPDRPPRRIVSGLRIRLRRGLCRGGAHRARRSKSTVNRARLDLPSGLARRAREFGVTFALDSDAHAAEHLANVEYAVGQARRAWVTPADVLNARPLADVLAFVAAKRSRLPGAI